MVVIDQIDVRQVRPHYLVQLQSPDVLHGVDSAPDWVHQSLIAAPFVVARRQPQHSGIIAVGVRGNSRNERWATFVDLNYVKQIVPPFELRCGNLFSNARFQTLPAFRSLWLLQERWSNLEVKWGPGGSVGFELASGLACTSLDSDLDIVLYAPQPISQEYAQSLHRSVQEISLSVDLLIEAPNCAFHLSEFATAGRGVPILLRTINGPCLGANPWSLQSVSGALVVHGQQSDVPA
jgi:phosphoribosyl-dephospho-CoA transferase